MTESFKKDQAGLDDRTFLAQFENMTLDPVHFSHLGHLRIAWLYLTDHDEDTAVELVCSGIKNYAESLGAHTKFHLTMTVSLVRIMASRLRTQNDKSWLGFVEANNDLVTDAIAVLLVYFSRDLLFSDEARTTLIAPDLKEI